MSKNRNNKNGRHPGNSGGSAIPYPSRDKVLLDGGLRDSTICALIVNGLIHIHLDHRQFLVFLALVSHSRKLAGSKPVLMEVPAVPYLSGGEILTSVTDYQKEQDFQPGLFSTSVSSTITTVIDQIRSKLTEARVNPYLIDSGPGGRGYRLGTAATNVKLVLHPLRDGPTGHRD